MFKVFISQPMRGRSDEEIIQERKEVEKFAQQKFNDKQVIIIDSFIKDAPTIEHPLWYLGKSLEYLSEADAAIFAPSWQKARGCQIELLACLFYDIPVYEMEEKEGD